MTGRILIVDDDPIQRRLIEEAVGKFGYAALTAVGGEEALAIVRSEDVALMVLDLVMPGLDGMGVLERLARDGIALPVIVQTSRGGIDTVVGAMRAGAFDFIVKPVSLERLAISIQNALKVTALEGEIRRIRRRSSAPVTFRHIVTRSPEMARVLRIGEKAAGSGIPILIEGESGVGKELVARAIQGTSERRGRPFVTVNCGAIPPNLVQSTLFGHEKGAFTGAIDRHVGKFQEAHGGTLFLDEVGELPLEVQVQLLRAIQQGEIEPVGARRSQKVDFRLISATNRRLIDLVKEGRFREDLYYRLNVYPIFVPPLRDRREDIEPLVRHFIARIAAEEGLSRISGISDEALAMLAAYDWPGNIRQLENAVFRAMVLCDSRELASGDFPQIAALSGHVSAIRRVENGDPAPVGAPLASPAPAMADAETPSPPQSDLIGVAVSEPARPMPAPFGFMRSLSDDGHVRPLTEVEEEMIRLAIDHYGGRMAEVARRLGIGRSTLYRKLKEYGLADSDDDSGVAAE